MFAKELRDIEEELNVPYPERKELVKEIAADLLASFERLCHQGMSPDEAHKEALRLFRFSSAELLGIYNTLLAVEIKNDYSLLLIGARESIVPLVFATLIASLVLFAHYGLKTMLHRWGAIGERS